jgi:hypothetical protein
MAGSPDIKVYTADNEYVASFKHYEDAAAFVAFRGVGTTVRFGHSKSMTLWIEGAEAFPARENYDGAAHIMQDRRLSISCALEVKRIGQAAFDAKYGRNA